MQPMTREALKGRGGGILYIALDGGVLPAFLNLFLSKIGYFP